MCVAVVVSGVSFPHPTILLVALCFLRFFFLLRTVDRTQTRGRLVVVLSRLRSRASLTGTCFLSLALRGLLLPTQIGFPTSTRTHARTHLYLHTRNRQRMMLSSEYPNFPSRLFLLHCAPCNFPVETVSGVASSLELQMCQKSKSTFLAFEGGFKSLGLVAIALVAEHCCRIKENT